MELSWQLSTSYNTDRKVKHKPMHVMKERDDACPLGGWAQLDDAYRGRQSRREKSERGAPGKTQFVAAVEPSREGRPMRLRLSQIGAFRSEEVGARARCHSRARHHRRVRRLGCFRAVRHAGCLYQPFATVEVSQQAPAIRRSPVRSTRSKATSGARCMARITAAEGATSGRAPLSVSEDGLIPIPEILAMTLPFAIASVLAERMKTPDTEWCRYRFAVWSAIYNKCYKERSARSRFVLAVSAEWRGPRRPRRASQ